MSKSSTSRYKLLMAIGVGSVVISAFLLRASAPTPATVGAFDVASTSTEPNKSLSRVAFKMPPPSTRGMRGKRSDQIPDIVLITHEGRPVRFYEEFVHDRKVAVNFMYTICNGICPGMTENIKKIRQEFAAKGRTDFIFVSVSIDPENDTPEQLRHYMAANEIENNPNLPPWIFVTGNIKDIDRLRYSIGVFDSDPVVDGDRTQHGGLITYGNDRSDWWAACPLLQPPKSTVEAMLRLTGDDFRRHPRHGLVNLTPHAVDDPESVSASTVIPWPNASTTE